MWDRRLHQAGGNPRVRHMHEPGGEGRLPEGRRPVRQGRSLCERQRWREPGRRGAVAEGRGGDAALGAGENPEGQAVCGAHD